MMQGHDRKQEESTRLQRSNDIRVLSFNINILPRGSSFVRRVGEEYKAQRVATFLTQYLGNYAIVALQEIFSTPHFPEVFCFQERLVARAMNAGFGFCYRGPQPGLGDLWRSKRWTDSGLLILSRFPIVRARYLTFKNSGGNADSKASKGVISALVALPDGSLVLIVNCHLQASHLVGSAQMSAAKTIRARQLHELEEFVAQEMQEVSDIYLKRFTHCLITGDFNIDAIADPMATNPGVFNPLLKQQRRESGEYLQLMSVLDRAGRCHANDLLKTANDGKHVATRPPRQQFPESFTAILRDKYPQRLDYVFGLKGDFSDTELERFAVRHRPFSYLSDHFGIVTTILPPQSSPSASRRATRSASFSSFFASSSTVNPQLEAEKVTWHLPPHRRLLWQGIVGTVVLLGCAGVLEVSMPSLIVLLFLGIVAAASFVYQRFRTSRLLSELLVRPPVGAVEGSVPNAHLVHLLPGNADTLGALIAKTTARYPGNRCLGAVSRDYDDQCRWLTYAEVQKRIKTIGWALLRDLHVQRGDCIGVWAPNCIEFVLVAQACYSFGLVCVPLFQAGTNFVLFQITHSKSRVAFVYDSRQVEYLLRRQSAVPELEYIVQIEPDSELNPDKFSFLLLQHKMKSRLQVLSFSLLEALGQRAPAAAEPTTPAPPLPNSICHVIYDFNSHGHIKAVQFTHANIISQCTALLQCTNVVPTDTHYCSLPLSQITELSATTLFLIQGASVGFPSASNDMLTDLRVIRPTLLLAPAAFYIHHYRQQRISIATWRMFKKLLYRFAYTQKLRALASDQRPNPIWDWLFFRHFAGQFAFPRLVLVLGDGCALPQVFREFIQVCFCTRTIELYAREECGVVAATFPHFAGLRPLYPNTILLSRDNDDELTALLNSKYGILVGGVPPGADAGMIVVEGPGVFDSYRNDAKLTAHCKSASQGFRSNEVGRWLDDGSLTIFGHKRGLLEPFRGCMVFDKYLETVYGASSFVSQLFIMCQRHKPLVAVVHPNEKYLNWWFATHQRGMPVPSLEGMCSNVAVRAAVLHDLKQIAAAARLSPIEGIHAIYLEPTPWTLENECLTPSLAIRRHNLSKTYESVFQSLYEQRADDSRFPSPLLPASSSTDDSLDSAPSTPTPARSHLRSSSMHLHTHSLNNSLLASDSSSDELDADPPLIAMEFDIQFSHWKKAFLHRLQRRLASQGVHVPMNVLEEADAVPAETPEQADPDDDIDRHHFSDSVSEFEEYPFI